MSNITKFMKVKFFSEIIPREEGQYRIGHKGVFKVVKNRFISLQYERKQEYILSVNKNQEIELAICELN
jgi:hypothetical protein